ncbi:phytoene desaturase [Alkalibacillus flavidus]|uniref:4,4'-diaponeurosporene oxygenase n=1 Tax=Alkalibacillus flavidus TaxID=546021 RepID=A0ABV2KT78_9BACI
MERTTLFMTKAIIIGAGLGGLANAIVLASNGYDVEVIEQNSEAGGKLQQRHAAGYHFDLGPSTITMTHMFSEVFALSGRDISDYIEFYPITAGTMNIFPDGTRIPFSPDTERVQAAIANVSEHDAAQYPAFLQRSESFYEIAEHHFLNRLMYRWQDKLDLTLIKQFMRIKPLTTYQDWLKGYFNHPYILNMFGRYATYIGSSPYQAPAIYGMMAYIEAGLGVYSVRGGTYQMVNAMRELAEELGVSITFNQEVTNIVTENGRAVGVEIAQDIVHADHIIANMDALTVYERFFPERATKVHKTEPSLSGFALLLGLDTRYDELQHHQVYFPEDYAKEFDQLFKTKELIDDPTIYICFSGYDDGSVVPSADHSNLFVLVNAPSQLEGVDWEDKKQSYTEHILDLLETKGLTNVRDHIDYIEAMTPQDLHWQTGAYQGAIYGASSNSFKQAFFRLPNKANDIDRLWFVGGSTHPGGGTPIVTRSGKLVAEAIMQEEAKT